MSIEGGALLELRLDYRYQFSRGEFVIVDLHIDAMKLVNTSTNIFRLISAVSLPLKIGTCIP